MADTASTPFDEGHIKANLKNLSISGGATTLIAQAVMLFLNIVSTIVLARLLTPEDFGLVAMVTTVTGFMRLFKDMGLPMATIQRKAITEQQVSTLFWVNMGLSCGFALVIAGLAPVIAWVYREPRLLWIAVALGGASLVSGLTVQHQALLARRMRFGILALSQVVSMLVGILAAIGAAWLGGRYWSLVVRELAATATAVAVVWIFSRWRPGLPVRGSGIKGMVMFGRNLVAYDLLNYIGRNGDNFLVGQVWGSWELGLYSKAYGLLMLPISQITAPIASVAIPALSRLQNDPERYRRYYYRALGAIAYVTMPATAVLGALSSEVVSVLLGSQWVGAAAIFKVLCLAAVLQPVVNPVGWVYVSLAQTRRQLTWGLIDVPTTVAAFFIGLPWGGYGIAVSLTVAFFLFTIPCLWWAFRQSPLSVLGWLRSIHRPLVISVVVYLSVEMVHGLARSWGLLPVILLGAGSGLACFMTLGALWPTARREILGMMSVLGTLRSSIRASAI